MNILSENTLYQNCDKVKTFGQNCQKENNITLFDLFGINIYLCQNLKTKDMNFNIITQDGRNFISAKELQSELNSTEKFATWIKRLIHRAYLTERLDFVCSIKQSTGGRPATDYLLTIEASKRISIIAGTKKSKEIIDYLIDLDKKREGLELITVKEAAFAVKVINCMKYIENQKEAYTLHKNHFVVKNIDIMNPKFIYSEFAKYRTSITGWTKDQINEAINKYISDHPGYDRKKIDKANMSTKLSIMDVGEAIRVAVLDILYSKETDSGLANRFSKLCKEMAKEMQVEAEKENKSNLFKDKENIENVKLITNGL